MLGYAALGPLTVVSPLVGLLLAALSQRREPIVVQVPEQLVNLTCVCSVPAATCQSEWYFVVALVALNAVLVLLLVLIAVSAACRRAAPAVGRQVTHSELLRQRSAQRSLI